MYLTAVDETVSQQPPTPWHRLVSTNTGRILFSAEGCAVVQLDQQEL
jgi:hypothetical protein